MGLSVMFAGGGTGGHIYPALAIAGELMKKAPGTKIMFIAGTKGMERTIIEKAGYRMDTISVASLPRRLSPTLVPFAWKLTASTLVSRRIIAKFRPSVLVATGGYVSGPPILAARFSGVPVLIQEQNSYPGITTRKLAGLAETVLLGFPEAANHFGKDIRTLETGNPVRHGIGKAKRNDSSALFGFDPAKKTVLVFGGSQGARAINRVMADVVKTLAVSDIQVLWQTGTAEYELYHSLDGYGDGRVKILAYIDNMTGAYGASDLVISRAGAMTLAEINECGLPAVLVPLPTAAANHQEYNARSLVERGAASMILECDLTPETMENEIRAIIDDNSRLRAMADASQEAGGRDAAGYIADLIIQRYKKN